MILDRILIHVLVAFVRCALLVVVPTLWAADAPACGPEIPEDTSGWQHNPDAEQWFRQQVERGNDARFEARFAADARQRTVRASVIEDLLLQSRRTVRLRMKGIFATCAVVVGSIGLRYAEVPEPVTLQGFTFLGDVDLSWTHFQKTLRLDGGHFRRDVSFNTATLGQALFLTDARFEGEANFGAFDVGGALVATGAQFRNPSKDAIANFNSAKVGNTMFFDHAVFYGPTSFEHVSIGLDFRGQGLEARNTAFPLDFRHMKAHRIRLQSALLSGQVWLGEVSADAIQLESLQQPVSGPPSIDLAQAVIRGQLSIKDAVLEDLIAPQIRVEGVAELRQVTIKRWFNFQHASFVHCAWFGVTLPANRWHAWFDGVSYEYISFTDDDVRDKFSALFQWPSRMRYSASVYAGLEKFLNDQGYSDAAKQIAIAQRRDDRARLSGIGWLNSCLLDILIGYGKRPFRAIWACLVVVIGGRFVFRRKAGMEPTKAEYATQWYSPAWYSFGLFLPVVDLEMSKVWRPRNDRRWARHYMRLHILLGWILVPLFAAGLAGLVK